MELTEKLREAIDEQEREVERAVIWRGKFRFKEECQHLQVDETQWFKMKPEQHQAHLRKVVTALVNTSTSDNSDNVTHTGGDSSQTKNISPLSLSFDVSPVSEEITMS